MSQTVTLTIPNISCGHCVMTITRETKDLPGVVKVEGDQQAKTATYHPGERGRAGKRQEDTGRDRVSGDELETGDWGLEVGRSSWR